MPPNTRRYFEESEQLLKGRSPESPEFAALMRSKVGGQFQGLVTPERLGVMALVGNPAESNWDTAGIRFNPLASEAQIKESLGPVLDDASQELQKGKRIFGIGSQADAGTYAHELRHENVGSEKVNRFFDVMYGSTSLPAYKANIKRAYDYLTDTPEYRKASFQERWVIDNAPLQQKEKLVLDALKGKANNWILKDAAKNEGISLAYAFESANIEDFIDRNLKLNKSGAVGATKGGKKLDPVVLEFRSKFPFLNFMGRLEESDIKKKSTGGNVEKVYIERKMI
jgi:hypothetical protein